MHLKDVCTLTNTHLHTRNWTRWKQKKITKLLALQASCCWSLWDESCNAGPSTPFSLNLPHVYATQSYNMQRPEGLHKCINKLVPDYLADMFKSRSQVHNRQTRSSGALDIPLCRLSTGQRSFAFRGAKLWNSLNDNIKSLKCPRNFRRHLANVLLSWYIILLIYIL